MRTAARDATLLVGRLETARGAFRGGPYDFAVEAGESLHLHGANGSGKSTLLETIAGVLPARGGTVRLGGSTWIGPGVRPLVPWRRGIGALFSGLGLWPHLSVRAQARLVAPHAEERIEALARALVLTPLLDRRPAALSGGEAQRAALLRALAPDPAVLLLDEPTSAQHADTATAVRSAIEAARRTGAIVIVASHETWDATRRLDLP